MCRVEAWCLCHPRATWRLEAWLTGAYHGSTHQHQPADGKSTQLCFIQCCLHDWAHSLKRRQWLTIETTHEPRPVVLLSFVIHIDCLPATLGRLKTVAVKHSAAHLHRMHLCCRFGLISDCCWTGWVLCLLTVLRGVVSCIFDGWIAGDSLHPQTTF